MAAQMILVHLVGVRVPIPLLLRPHFFECGLFLCRDFLFYGETFGYRMADLMEGTG